MRKRPLLWLMLAVVVLLLLPAVAEAKPSYNSAVDKLLKQGYPQSVTKAISQMGDSRLGFRMAGSPSDNKAARYIADQLRAMGLRGVKLERVPLDVWDFRSAHLTVRGGTYAAPVKYIASPFAGARGTPAEGLSGDIVYVGFGTEDEFDAAGDVTGKIVLVDLDGYDWWMNFPQMLAGQRGAKAVIMTHAVDDLDPTGEYFTQPDALGCFDAESDYDAPPMVYISRASGSALRTAAIAGGVSGTLKADVRIRLEDDGGYGYNVIGKIPGTTNAAQMVLFSSHHDAYFKGVMDDTSAVATELTIAKAMKMSGLKPRKTVVFLFTTGEEFGTTNSWYDWLIGAYHFIDKAHPDWAGRIAADINLEWQGLKNAPLQVRANPEMATYVQETLDANPSLAPYGVDNDGKVRPYVWTWNDQWPFTAKGVPSVYFVAKDADYRGQWYHSQYDDLSLIDWSYVGKAAKLYRLVHRGVDQGLLPYDFSARAAQLADTVDDATLLEAGADPAEVAQLRRRLDRFVETAAEWAALKGFVHSGQYGLVNRRLMEVERILNSSLTALDQWDGACYPHEQVLDDVQNLSDTLEALSTDPMTPEAKADALGALYDVGPFYYGDYFGEQVYDRQLVRQRQDYYRINWGGLGHLEPYPDIYDEYEQIEADEYSAAAKRLTAEWKDLVGELDQRIDDIGRALDDADDLLQSVTPWWPAPVGR